MSNLNEIVDELSNLKVLQMVELVEMLEKKWNVSAAVSAMAPVASAAPSAAPVAEKSSFNVVLTDAGASRINVVKLVREVTGLGLHESKTLVDSAPKSVKEGVNKTEADELKKKLEEAGATIELK